MPSTIKSLPPNDALDLRPAKAASVRHAVAAQRIAGKTSAALAGDAAFRRSAATRPPPRNTHPNVRYALRRNDGAEVVRLGPPSSPTRSAGSGRYRVLKVLGRGGMGVVFQAEDPKLKRPVALKAMLPRLAAGASAAALPPRSPGHGRRPSRSRRHHLQVDEDHGVPFLAMEFLQGMPLDNGSKTAASRTSPQILRIGREIAEGLAAAHERGLIHRDIKPGQHLARFRP